MELVKEKWTTDDYKEFIKYLYTLQDIKYQKFHSNLVPNINNFIGIKMPILKKIAKQIVKGNYKDFIKLNNHTLYEEIMIHGYIISNIKEPVNNIIEYINDYLKYINNWAICDSFCASLKIKDESKKTFYNYICKKIQNKNQWIKRFCYVIILNNYIEKEYIEEVFTLCDKYNTTDYYVQMSVAWLISTAYIKYKEETIKYIHNNNLDLFTYNKALQKIIESNKIEKEEKEEIKLLKRKET